MSLPTKNLAHRIFNLLLEGTLAISSETVFWSDYFEVIKNSTYGFQYQFTSSGTINCKIELEQGNTVPNARAIDATWAVPEDAPAFDAVVGDANMHYKAYNPIATKFARFKVTGLSGVHASTILTLAKAGFFKDL